MHRERAARRHHAEQTEQTHLCRSTPPPPEIQPHSEFAAEIIHEELGFDEILKRERAAMAALQRKHAALVSFSHKDDGIASFKRERISACRKFMPADTC